MATGLAGIDAAAITGASSLNATDTTAMSIADATTLTSLSNWVGHDADSNAATAGLYYLSDGFAAVQGADATLVNNATTVVADGTDDVDTMNMSMHSAGMTITGGKGKDVITGTSGADTIDGEEADDTIAGGDGNDQFTISAGDDTITDLTTGDIVDVAADASVTATGVTAFVATVDTANLGSEAADFAIVAAAAGSTVDMDLATVGTAGTDGFTLTGGAGVDTFTGSDGADTIAGGASGDSLTGGAGVDTFVFATGGSGQAAATADVITDFTSGTDIIDYTAADGTAVALTLVAEGTKGAGQAAIAADGTATFNGADDTLAKQIIAVEAGMTAGTAVAGETAIFADPAKAANSYIFVSDGTAGVDANDLLIHIVGDQAGAITLADGNITVIA
jgi:Ca2+-binding RTX toxin-like protein